MRRPTSLPPRRALRARPSLLRGLAVGLLALVAPWPAVLTPASAASQASTTNPAPAAGKARPAGQAAARPVAAVQTVTPAMATRPVMLTAYGSLEFDPRRVRTLSLARAGQVAEVRVVPGQAVRRGEALLTFAADPQSLAAWRQARTAEAAAQAELDRLAALRARQLATRSQVTAARKTLDDARAATRALAVTGAGQALSTLEAPVAGLVTALPVATGDRPAAGAALAQLAPRDALLARLGVEPRQAGKIAAGAPARLHALDGADCGPGKVTQVGGLLDPKTRLAPVSVRPAATACPANTALRAAITVGQARGWRLPREAVLEDARGAHVFEVRAARARRAAVRVILDEGATLLVRGPLGGAPVVTVGAYVLEDGMRVRRMAEAGGATPTDTAPAHAGDAHAGTGQAAQP